MRSHSPPSATRPLLTAIALCLLMAVPAHATDMTPLIPYFIAQALLCLTSAVQVVWAIAVAIMFGQRRFRSKSKTMAITGISLAVALLLIGAFLNSNPEPEEAFPWGTVAISASVLFSCFAPAVQYATLNAPDEAQSP